MANSTKKIALKEPSILADKVILPREETIIYGFPKEFKKKWIQSIDFLFLKILIFTMIFEVGLIFFLTSVLKTTNRPVNVEKIQKQYAHLLLDNLPEPVPEKLSAESAPPSNLIAVNDEAILPEESTGASETETANDVSISIPNRRGSGVTSFTQRRSGAGKTERSANAMSRKVSQTGILRYIISSPNSGYEEELKAVYASGDANAEILEKATEKMDIVRFRSAGAMFQPISAEQLNVLEKLKGTTVVVDAKEELRHLNQINKINLEDENKVEKLDYEHDELLHPAKPTAKVRTPEQVTKVIQSHARTIQDCYQQAVRRNPELKGKVTVRISVAPNGRVVDVQLVESTIQDAQMLRCILHRIRRWRDFGVINDEAGILNYRQSYVFGY